MINKILNFISNNKSLSIIIGITILLMIPGFMYLGVEVTSSPKFCGSCHEMDQAYDTWINSSHYPTKTNKGATCRQCHISSWKHPIDVITEKTYHGLKDIYHHFASSHKFSKENFNEEMKIHSRKTIPVRSCFECHETMLRNNKHKLATLHYELYKDTKIYSPKDTQSCLDCHKNLVHF